ncbi:hypothetical protein T02_14416 [Trichinella nativa]|uniref:Uncharacterized protein n=1 Tax=Trichinella nativa TaxID=6335 RepID=A0A0V1LSM0_9BILA|nr:hypothetical protein T02_14416 [Trichinella nativa]
MLMLELIISLSRYLRNVSHQLPLDDILNLQSTVKKATMWLASYIWKANKRQDYGLKFAY